MRYIAYKEHYKRFFESHSKNPNLVTSTFDYRRTKYKTDIVKYYNYITNDIYDNLFDRYMNDDIVIDADM